MRVLREEFFVKLSGKNFEGIEEKQGDRKNPPPPASTPRPPASTRLRPMGFLKKAKKKWDKIPPKKYKAGQKKNNTTKSFRNKNFSEK